MLVPLYGFVEGDTMGILVLAHDTMTIEAVIASMKQAVSVRIDVTACAWRLECDSKVLPPDATVASINLEAMQRIDLRRNTEP